MKKVMATIGVLALLAGNSFAQEDARKEAAPAEKRAEIRSKSHKGIMADIPDLTEEQRTQIKSIKEEGRKKMEPQHKEMKMLRSKIMELKMAENPNEKEINTLIDKSALIKAEMEKSRTASELKVRSILTPEQRVVLDSKMKEKMADRERRHKEHKQMREAK
jgi:Spy/CpxP family protein refolding chaperone